MTDPTAPVLRAATVTRPPAEAFRIFTEEIGAWWPLPSHGLYHERAGGLAFRDGSLIETSVDGSENAWAEVVAWDPPAHLAVAWHPGLGPDDASRVEVHFEPVDTGTRVVIEHHGWEQFGEDALVRRRNYVGPGAWGYVLDHFADGAEARFDGPDLRDLAAAYDTFFGIAEAGTFGPAPSPGEWDADETLAHVALNDAAMLAVCQAIVHGDAPRFENTVCQNPDALRRWITSCGSRAELIARGRHQAQQVLAALGRLSPAQRATEIHCCLRHAGETMLDAPRPWGAVAIDVQTNVHLPAHVEQLENLR